MDYFLGKAIGSMAGGMASLGTAFQENLELETARQLRDLHDA
jgi:hypothetical protein